MSQDRVVSPALSSEDEGVEEHQRAPSTEYEPLLHSPNLGDLKYQDYGDLQSILSAGPSSWLPAEDRRVVMKTDLRIMSWGCVLFFSMQINRISIENVLTTDFINDMGMQQRDYNLGQTAYLICFLLFEIPIQIITVVLGPHRVIPTTAVLWAIVGFSQTFMKSRTTFLITRSLLGACEGGFTSGLVLYLTSFYKSYEMSSRLAMVWATLYLTNVVSAVLAPAVFALFRNTAGGNAAQEWRGLFFVEGILTIVIGTVSFYLLPAIDAVPRISRVYTPREEAILRARVILDDPSKAVALAGRRTSTSAAGRRNRAMQNFSLRQILETLFNPYLCVVFVLGFTGFIPSIASYHFFTLILHGMGFSTTLSNVLVIPGNIMLVVGMIIVARMSDARKVHWPAPIFAMLWVLPFLIILIVLPDNSPTWLRVVALTFVVGFPYYTPVLASWVSANANDQGVRGVAIALYNVAVQLGNIAAVNVYRTADAPYYRRGNSVLVAVAVGNIALAAATRWWFARTNRRRERRLAAMTDTAGTMATTAAGVVCPKPPDTYCLCL
ncbi:major facilitator superfamily domain-containing protein [Limtongia smithiae]|uniref:major facilitator superfamily domain-containing protein n=1 Tax=Limtongia smithiae TaxID=1125753 RepID=UPI0034CFF4F8